MSDFDYDPIKREYVETTWNGMYYGLRATKGFIDDFGNFVVIED